ncbi:UTP--glucose-1-phosphate uridylyltransferase protein [Marine Group I thaumarchaeote SCGC AAA799-B03]|uniref:UTP--glucose-1-phosphate uridylyltransferase n=1 Tax=Marine Group I thaumarchaeote SCGC AAA799-B03 TaxID=1502289 RepID=A0A087S902_9ARCH|nr:UTP--glucose-1-phosphate uridylyltransferase protein [Marine Group I thaumarchaeote SCGC AAA799-B03]
MDQILKVVIPAAGSGTRLLSATKEQPKEMLPIFSKDSNEKVVLKPIIQVIFEQLYDCGFRDFYFIVGRTKRVLEDHFTPDYNYINELKKKNKSEQAIELENFYERLEQSTIAWINQPSPKGFGDAVNLVKNLIGNKTFLVHAGDTLLSSVNNNHITSLINMHNSEKNDCSLLVRKVDDPKPFGIIDGEINSSDHINVTYIEEKPDNPKSNLAIMPLYVFETSIFDILSKTKPGKGNEIQLTDGIKGILEKGLRVYAMKMKDDDLWIDVGSPETYWDAQSKTYEQHARKD